jgi:hypothetical protein
MANHGYYDLAAMWEGAGICLRHLTPKDVALLEKALQWPKQPEYKHEATLDGGEGSWDDPGRRGRNFEEVSNCKFPKVC